MKNNINTSVDFEGTTLVTEKSVWKKDMFIQVCGGKIEVDKCSELIEISGISRKEEKNDKGNYNAYDSIS